MEKKHKELILSLDKGAKEHFNIKNLTTFKIDSSAAVYCEPKEHSLMKELISACRKDGVPYFILGGGSNSLPQDGEIDAVIISTLGLNDIRPEGEQRLCAGAGASMNALCKAACEKSLSGLEWAGGLPGSVGGAVYMNARCYGSEISECVESVTVLNSTNEIERVARKDMDFAYKLSPFQRGSALILEACFKLRMGNYDEIKKVMDSNIEDRRSKQQYSYPSAGCVFENNRDIGKPSGKLIEELGFKGEQLGGALVADFHANFIVNADGRAKATDVYRLMEKIRRAAKRETGFDLKPELRLMGDFSNIDLID